jgi:subtilisin family serine protease
VERASLPARLAAALTVLVAGLPVGWQPAAQESPVRREIFVRFHAPPPGDIARWARERLGVGAEVVRRYTSVPDLYLLRVPPGVDVPGAVGRARRLREVRYAERNKRVEPQKSPNEALFASNTLWHLPMIDAPCAWHVTTGSREVVVAVLDTGVDAQHRDLADNTVTALPGCSTCTDECQLDVLGGDCDPADEDGHGTQVAGVIGAVGNNGMDVVGVNWQVQLLPCRFIGSPGEGSIDGAIACLDRVAKARQDGMKVVATNNSWVVLEQDLADDERMDALRDAIDQQREQGILFVAAAGNGPVKARWGPAGTSDSQDSDLAPVWPAAFLLPNVIAVASVDKGEKPATDSHVGSATVHLWAPGAKVITTSKGGGHGTASGTSLAAPQVAGAVALLHAASRGLDWKAIKNLVLAGGTDVDDGLTVTGKRLSLLGSLPGVCREARVRSRVRPTTQAICTVVGAKTLLAVISVNCEKPDGPVSVSVVDPNGVAQTVILSDPEGDGLFVEEWIPALAGDHTVTFTATDQVTATVCAHSCPCP